MRGHAATQVSLFALVLSKWLLAAADTQIQEPSLAGMPLSDAEYEQFFSILRSPHRIRAVCFLRAMYGCQNPLIQALDQYENHGVIPEGRVCSDLEEHSTFPDFCNLAFYRCTVRKYYVKRVPCPGDRNKEREFLHIISPETEPGEIVQSSIEAAVANLLRDSPAASTTTPEPFSELLAAMPPSTTDAAELFSELLNTPAAVATTELVPELLVDTSDKATPEPLLDILAELSLVPSTTTIATKSMLELIAESSLKHLAQSAATIASESLLEPLVLTPATTTKESFPDPPTAMPTFATAARKTTPDAVATAESNPITPVATSATTTTGLLPGVLSRSSPDPPESTATSTAAKPSPQLLSPSPPVSANESFPEPPTTSVAESTESFPQPLSTSAATGPQESVAELSTSTSTSTTTHPDSNTTEYPPTLDTTTELSTSTESSPDLATTRSEATTAASFPTSHSTTESNITTDAPNNTSVATTAEPSSEPPNYRVTTAAESSATNPTTTAKSTITSATSAKALCLCVSESPTLPKEDTTTKAPTAATSSTITSSPQPFVSTLSVAQHKLPQSSSSMHTVITPTSTEKQKTKPEEAVETPPLLPATASPVTVMQQEKIPKFQEYASPTASLAELFFQVQNRKVQQLMQAMRDLLTKRRREQLQQPTSPQPLKTLTHASMQSKTKQSPKVKDRFQR